MHIQAKIKKKYIPLLENKDISHTGKETYISFSNPTSIPDTRIYNTGKMDKDL
jgi:hypothetical protein